MKSAKVGNEKHRSRKPSAPAKRAPRKQPKWLLRLYVAGRTAKGVAALENLRAICERHLVGRYRLDVVDLLENPKLAAGDQIVALPTLVRRLPAPLRKILGDLSNTERVLVGLDIQAGGVSP